MGRRPDNTRSPEEQLAIIRAKKAEYARRWRMKNPDRQAAIIRRYWAKKLAMVDTTQRTGEPSQCD